MKESMRTTCLICGVLLSAATLLLQAVGACMRSAQPATIENVSAQVEITTAAPTSNIIQEPCTSNQSEQHICRNGGTCYQRLNIFDESYLQIYCECPSNYKGEFCEKYNRVRESTIMEDNPEVVAAVVAGLIVALIIVVVIVALCRMKNRRQQSNSELSAEIRDQKNAVNGNGCADGHGNTRIPEENKQLLELSNIRNNNAEMEPV